MAGMVPYSDYEKALRRVWPFAAIDDFFAPLAVSDADAFNMDVEDAGDKKDQVDIELNEGRLSISVDKKESDEQKDKNYLQKETSEWQATRGVYLKDAANEGISAKMDGGVLTVDVPKQEEKKTNVTKVTIE